MWIAGLMSGTSLDGVDVALLETDGEKILSFGPGLERPYSRSERAVLQTAVDDAIQWKFSGPRSDSFKAAERVLSRSHAEAVKDVCSLKGMLCKDLDLVGFHGQTVIHQAPIDGKPGKTCQLGSGEDLAHELQTDVVFDFRSADVEAGGHGAPLAPVYHKTLVKMSGLESPIAVLNLGGVANITLIGSDGDLIAFDTGPANGLLDAFMEARTGSSMDRNGDTASKGQVHEASFSDYLANHYFSIKGPKSLDRWDFSLRPVQNLSLEDGAATLTAFTAKTVAMSLKHLPEMPRQIIATGGGRKNKIMLELIKAATGLPVYTAEDVGWRGDLIEAEAFAFLAARSKQGLPISFPGTTGVPEAMTGGKLAKAD